MSPQLNQAKVLRLAGRYQEAAQVLRQEISANSSDAFALSEGLRLVVLLNDNPQIKALLDILARHPQFLEAVETELYVRAHVKLGLDLPQPLPKFENSCQPKWLENKQSYQSDILDFDFLTGVGAPTYCFTVNCADCGHKTQTTVYAGFFFKKEWLCPSCLAAHNLDHKGMEKYFKESNNALTSQDLEKYDILSQDLQKRVGNFEDENIPFLCRGLNQNLVYYYNEIVAKRLLGKK
jgi:hypothetical protein